MIEISLCRDDFVFRCVFSGQIAVNVYFFLFPHDVLSADWAAETAILWLRAQIPDSCDVTLKSRIKKEF